MLLISVPISLLTCLQRMTKTIKQVRFTSSCKTSPLNHVQVKVAPNIDRAWPKAKGKKAKDSTEPVRGCKLLKATPKQVSFGNVHLGDQVLSVLQYNPPCKRCTEGPCLIVVGRKGHAIKSCAKCHNMKVQCS
jgi:hypothetical protein